MATPTTNYTTYDLAYYYADLKHIRRLSDEERQRLVTGLCPSSPEAFVVKQQLIESFLPLVKSFTIDLCPNMQYARFFPDLIGAANLQLVEAIHRANLSSIHETISYLLTCIRGAVYKALAQEENLIKVNSTVRKRVQEQGGPDATLLYHLSHVASIEHEMEWDNSDALQEPPMTPILPIEQAPALARAFLHEHKHILPKKRERSDV